MQLSSLYELAEDQEISVFAYHLPNAETLSITTSGNCYIGIDPFSLRTTAEEKTKLAHELGHCMTGAFYNEQYRFAVRAKFERIADVWAIKKLIPKDELLNAVSHGYTERWELAEYFDVTEELMNKAISTSIYSFK